MAILVEAERLRSLETYEIFNTPPEPAYDAIVASAAEVFRTAIALASFVGADSQWFKARIGTDLEGSENEISFCKQALAINDVVVIADARCDQRFADNPLVLGAPFISFYASAPIRSDTGLPLGGLCVIDSEPRPEGLGAGERMLLQIMADQVSALLEGRRLALLLRRLALGQPSKTEDWWSRRYGPLGAPKHAPLGESVQGDLTLRQQQVLGWSAEGKSAPETAIILGVSARTIRFHLDEACKRLGAVRPKQAVAIALRRGLISSPIDA